MKVLFVANAILDSDDPGFAGGDIRFISIAKKLQERGHDIHLLGTEGGRKLCNKFGLDVTLHAMEGGHTSKGRIAFIFRTIRSFFSLPATLDSFANGVVFSTNEMLCDVMPALRLKLRGRARIRWGTVVHWLPPFPPWRRKESSLINSTLFFINERLSVILANRFSDALLAVSTSTAKQLYEFGANVRKVKTVACGVDYDRIRCIAERTKTKIYDAVFMKRLQAVKGVFDVVEIWEMVVKSKPDAKLLIIGEGIDGEAARKMVTERKLGGNIEFAGVIFDEVEKFSKISASELFLLPTYEENWAIVIGEAMAAGTPVVAYGLPELKEVWEGQFESIEIGDKVEFSERIVSLLGSRKSMSEKSKRGLLFAKKYDWETIAKNELESVL